MTPREVREHNPDLPVLLLLQPSGEKTLYAVGTLVGYANKGDLAVVIVVDQLDNSNRPVLVLPHSHVERGVKIKESGEGSGGGIHLLSPRDKP